MILCTYVLHWMTNICARMRNKFCICLRSAKCVCTFGMWWSRVFGNDVLNNWLWLCSGYKKLDRWNQHSWNGSFLIIIKFLHVIYTTRRYLWSADFDLQFLIELVAVSFAILVKWTFFIFRIKKYWDPQNSI